MKKYGKYDYKTNNRVIVFKTIDGQIVCGMKKHNYFIFFI